MKKFFLMMIAIVALTACNGNKFHIDGTLEGASDTTTLILEQSSNGEWFIIDSVKVSKDGKFSISVKPGATLVFSSIGYATLSHQHHARRLARRTRTTIHHSRCNAAH